MAKKSQPADWEAAISRIAAGNTVLEYAANRDICSKQTEGVVTPQKSPPKVVSASGKCKHPLATANEKTQVVDRTAFLARISRAKPVLEYGANRTIFAQGDPAHSLWYVQDGKVKLAVTSKQGKEAIITILSDNEFFGEGCLAGQGLRLF